MSVALRRVRVRNVLHGGVALRDGWVGPHGRVCVVRQVVFLCFFGFKMSNSEIPIIIITMRKFELLIMNILFPKLYKNNIFA